MDFHVRLRTRGDDDGRKAAHRRQAQGEALGASAAKEVTPPEHYGADGIGASLTQTLKKPALPAGLGAASVVSPVAGVDAPGHASASSDEAEADAW